MSNYSKPKCKPNDPCRAQLYKTVKYQYYRYPVKYICTPVEWDTKCEKHVIWEPQKPHPPIKVPCEELKHENNLYGKEQQRNQAPEFGCEQDDSGYKQDSYAQEFQDGEEDGSYPEFGYSGN